MASTGSNSSLQRAEAAAERVDVVVAITSHNDVDTIGMVVHAVSDGLTALVGPGAARVLLADAGSTDGTRQVARETAGATLLELDYEHGPAFTGLPYHGQPARAAALRTILQTALRLDAKACAIIDARTQSVQPDAIDRFIVPVLTDGFDYVSPYYERHVNEGAITKAIVSPMFRALYGVRLRQPAGNEFCCSARLAAHFLEEDLWEAEQAPIGIDLWLATASVCGDFRACEALSGRRSATSRRTSADLSTTLAQVVGALFADLEHRVDVWQRVRGSSAVPVFGTRTGLDTEAPPLNVEALLESFRLGYRELRDIWTWVLPARTIVELRRLTEVRPELLRFDDRMWARIVYDFAAGYAFRVMPHDHLLRSLTPLYSGWLASFVLQGTGDSAEPVEERLEQLCLAFEAEKRHLISRWRWPERLR